MTKIADAVEKISETVTGGYQKIENKFSETFLEEDGSLKTGKIGEAVTEGYKKIENGVETELLGVALTKLNTREREIMELRYGLKGGEEKTQKEVADMLGISQSYISRLEKKIIVRLKKEFSKMV